MPAPKGNNYPEKWTEEKALKFFNESLKLLKEDQSIYFIGTLAVNMGWYRQIYPYLYEKFKDSNEVFNLIKKSIIAICESRLLEKGFTDGATMAIFTLKNHHEWKDKSEVLQTNQDKSDEAIDARISELLSEAGIKAVIEGEEEAEID